MTRTHLYDRLVSDGARMGEYCGAETAASFGDPRAEYAALIRGCGVYDLGWRARIVLTGSDRVRWMNGMVTNNVRDLPAMRGNYNFLLNAQGRILADLYVYNLGDHLLVDTELWQAENVKQIFDKFIIMDDVEVTDISDKLTGLGVQGPKAADVLRAVGLTLAGGAQALAVEKLVWNNIGLSVTRMASEVAFIYEIWAAPANIGAIWNAVVTAGAKPAGTEALEMFRVAAGVPRYGLDIRDRDLPQETEQKHALHFAKGCYIGQEIVERIHSRGAVHRQLAGFVFEGGKPPAGTKIEANGKEVGEITSALKVPASGEEKTFALGYIRKEAAQPGATVQVNGSQARVVRLPFQEALA